MNIMSAARMPALVILVGVLALSLGASDAVAKSGKPAKTRAPVLTITATVKVEKNAKGKVVSVALVDAEGEEIPVKLDSKARKLAKHDGERFEVSGSMTKKRVKKGADPVMELKLKKFKKAAEEAPEPPEEDPGYDEDEIE